MTECHSDKPKAVGLPDGQASLQLPPFQLSVVSSPPDRRKLFTQHLNRAEIFND
jgi:hypothetical protein